MALGDCAVPPSPPQYPQKYDSKENKDKKSSLAQAGLDLFLSGFMFDAKNPCNVEPRHPAVSPNLGRIEEDSILDHEESMESQLIVLIGGTVDSLGNPGVLLQNRIDVTSDLYQRILEKFKSKGATSQCYVVPTGGDFTDSGTTEMEIVRRHLIKRGIPSHQIIMDCTVHSTIENSIKLVPILKRLHISNIHIVTSEYHIPRTKLCIDGILGSAKGIEFNILYHAAADGMTSLERTERDSIEQNLLCRAQTALHLAMERVSKM